MAGSAANQITGDDVISELIRNADAGWFKVRYTILVPCIFNVYLHPRDYELIQPIAELIREEAVRALNTSKVKERFFNNGSEAVGSTPEELAATIRTESARMGKVIKDAGIRTQ